MATYTDNLKLIKPDITDDVSPSPFNDNFEKIDKIWSHVGMIIHSTTLDTEAKVKAIYGGNTWAKIEGRFLLGQSSTYAVNSTGGSATNTHSHFQTFGSDGGNSYSTLESGTSSRIKEIKRSILNITDVGTYYTCENKTYDETINTMPPYKTVYIWERTA